MDYDYGQEQTQFQDNIVAYNGDEEEDCYDETQQQKQQIAVGGNGSRQFLNRDSSFSSSQGKLFVGGVSWETTAVIWAIIFVAFLTPIAALWIILNPTLTRKEMMKMK